MNSTALVPVFTGALNNQTTLLCDAKDLHSFLEVGTRFNDWIIRRIAEYGFIEGEDYYSNLSNKSDGLRGKPGIDYHITLDMAKELGMVERNEKGRQIRRYFIACEQALSQPVKVIPSKREIKSRDDLSFTKRNENGCLINWSVPHDQNGDWHEGVVIGEGHFEEVIQLFEFSESSAYDAMRFALSGSLDFRRGGSTEFRNNGWGIETGFVQAIASAAIDGIRARKGGQEPFDAKAEGNKGRKPKVTKPKTSALPSAPIQVNMDWHCIDQITAKSKQPLKINATA